MVSRVRWGEAIYLRGNGSPCPRGDTAEYRAFPSKAKHFKLHSPHAAGRISVPNQSDYNAAENAPDNGG